MSTPFETPINPDDVKEVRIFRADNGELQAEAKILSLGELRTIAQAPDRELITTIRLPSVLIRIAEAIRRSHLPE